MNWFFASLKAVCSNRLAAGLILPFLCILLFTGGCAGDKLDMPNAVRLGPDGMLYVSNHGRKEIIAIDPESGRIKKSFRHSAFEAVYGFDVDPRGRLAVVSLVEGDLDTEGDVFTGAGLLLEKESGRWTAFGGEAGFHYPLSACFTRDGGIVVADAGKHQLLKFSSDLRFEKAAGGLGPGPAQLFYPQDVKEAPDGRLWVVESYQSRVKILGQNLETQKLYPPGGFDRDRLFLPQNVDFDRKGFAYVTETGNMRVSMFSPDLEPAGVIPVPPSPTGRLFLLTGIAVIGDDRLAVVDSTNSRLMILDMQGRLLRVIGG